MKVVQDAELENKNFPATSRRNINISLTYFFQDAKTKHSELSTPEFFSLKKVNGR